MLLFGLIVLAGYPALSFSRVKLIALPQRERVEIHLEREQAILVQETRIVPLVQGHNQVDFSWNNLTLDQNSIIFQTLAPTEGEPFAVRPLAASYPPNENAVIWEVFAERAGAVEVRISYLLEGLTPSYAYRALADEDEQHLNVTQYLRLNNQAGEEYGPAYLWTRSKEIGPIPLQREETKQVVVADYAKVPVRKTYTCGVEETGWLDSAKNKLRVPMHYILRNNAQNSLGKAALPYGKVRIFQQDGHGGSAFIGEDWGLFTPIDDEMKLYLGLAQDIVAVRTIEKNEATQVAGNLSQINVVVKYVLENFKDQPVVLNVIEHIPALRNQLYGDHGRPVEWTLGPDTTFPTPPDAEKSDAYQVVFPTPLPPRTADDKVDKQEYRLHLILRNEW